jgi:RNA polymerase sigma-70 factor (ECF subfamily)
VKLYDRLLEARPSPVVALSRAIAIAERSGPHAGLEAIDSIEQKERLADYPFYEAALGELLRRAGDPDGARKHFAAAAALARSPMERRFFEERAGP